jgi:hypothetical protein
VKKLFWKLTRIVFVALLSVNSSCGGPSETKKAGSDIMVQIPVYGRLGPRLETVKLLGIEDLSSVSGQYARFFYAPKVDSEITGSRPHARFTKNPAGVFIPHNQISAEMATLYYHIQNLAEFDQRMGIGHLNRGPRDVGILTRIRSKKGGFVHNQAYYDAGSDSILFVEYTLQGLPLTLSPGALAHEHFHSLFYKILLGPVTAQEKFSEKFLSPEDESQEKTAMEDFLYRSVLVKALNEGLADYWAWLYTGDEDFVGRSFETDARSVKITDDIFPTGSVNGYVKMVLRQPPYKSEDIRDMQESLEGQAYRLGTHYARFFRRVDLEPKRLILFLEELKKDILSGKDFVKLIEPRGIVRKYRDFNPEAAGDYCREFARVLGGRCE